MQNFYKKDDMRPWAPMHYRSSVDTYNLCALVRSRSTHQSFILASRQDATMARDSFS